MQGFFSKKTGSRPYSIRIEYGLLPVLCRQSSRLYRRALDPKKAFCSKGQTAIIIESEALKCFLLVLPTGTTMPNASLAKESEGQR